MNDTLRKIQESNPPLPAPAVPPPVNPPQLPQVLPPVSPPPSVHTALFTHRRSRSQPCAREHLREDADLHFDKRPHSQHRSPLRQRTTSIRPRRSHRRFSRSPWPSWLRLRSRTKSPSPTLANSLQNQRHDYYSDWSSQPKSSYQDWTYASQSRPPGHYQDWSSTPQSSWKKDQPHDWSSTSPLLIITIKNRTNSMVGNTTQPPDGVSPTNPTIRINPPYIPTKSASKRHNLLPNLSQLTLLIHLSMPTTC